MSGTCEECGEDRPLDHHDRLDLDLCDECMTVADESADWDGPEPLDLDGQYATEAVESVVRDLDRETIGHVGLVDLDGTTFGQAVEAAECLPGPVAVLTSSPKSHHLWGLAVMSLDEWQAEIESLPTVDAAHVALSERRERGVLRIAEKIRLTDGEAIKPAPRFEDVVSIGEQTLPLSRPHSRILRDDLGADAGPGWATDFVGHSTARRSYMAEIGGR